MLNATVDPDWHGRWNLRRSSPTRCHRGWRRPTVYSHWWTVFRCNPREQRLHRNRSRQPPSRCRVCRGLAPDVFLTTVRATSVLCQFDGWSTRHEYGLARRSKLWRWPASLVPDAHCTPSSFCQPAVQTRCRAPRRTAREPRAPTNKVNTRLPSFLCFYVWRIPLRRFDHVSWI